MGVVVVVVNMDCPALTKQERWKSIKGCLKKEPFYLSMWTADPRLYVKCDACLTETQRKAKAAPCVIQYAEFMKDMDVCGRGDPDWVEVFTEPDWPEKVCEHKFFSLLEDYKATFHSKKDTQLLGLLSRETTDLVDFDRSEQLLQQWNGRKVEPL